MNIKNIAFKAVGISIAALVFYQLFLKEPMKNTNTETKKEALIQKVAKTKPEIKFIDKWALMGFLSEHKNKSGAELIGFIENNIDGLQAYVGTDDVDPDELLDYVLKESKLLRDDDQPEIDPWDHM